MIANVSKTDMQAVADQITANTIFCTKEVLTSKEAAKYMGISMGYLYALTSKHLIPYSKPMGRKCYFNRTELETWLQGNHIASDIEVRQNAQTYCMKKGGLK